MEILEKYLDLAFHPTVKEKLRKLEAALRKNEFRTADQLRKLLQKRSGEDINQTYLQRLIKTLNVFYEEYYKEHGGNRVIRKKGDGSANAPNPRYFLEHRDFNLMFPEDAFDEGNRTKLNSVLRMAMFFNGSLPIKDILVHSDVSQREIESSIKDMERISDVPQNATVFSALAILYRSIENGKRVKFEYKPFGSVEVHPYFLKTFNGKWFLLGRIRRSEYLWTVFTLNRISKLEETPNDSLPLEDNVRKLIRRYYENVIGYDVPIPIEAKNEDGRARNTDMKPPESYKIVAKFKKELERYLEENPIHKSQRILKDVDDNDQLTLILYVSENSLLYKSILSYGNDLEVLEPTFIRDKIAQVIASMGKTYKITQKV